MEDSEALGDSIPYINIQLTQKVLNVLIDIKQVRLFIEKGHINPKGIDEDSVREAERIIQLRWQECYRVARFMEIPWAQLEDNRRVEPFETFIRTAARSILISHKAHKICWKLISNEDVDFSDKPKKNFTYLMKHSRTGLFKIGRAKNPHHRERTLQAEDPQTNLFVYWESGKEAETALHQHFKEFRERGEWFRLKDYQIAIIFDYFDENWSVPVQCHPSLNKKFYGGNWKLRRKRMIDKNLGPGDPLETLAEFYPPLAEVLEKPV